LDSRLNPASDLMRSFPACPETVLGQTGEWHAMKQSCKCWRQEGKTHSWTDGKQGLRELWLKVLNLHILLKPTSPTSLFIVLLCCSNLYPN